MDPKPHHLVRLECYVREMPVVLVSKVSGFTELVTGRHANDGTRQVPASGLNHCVTEGNFFYMEVTSMRVPG